MTLKSMSWAAAAAGLVVAALAAGCAAGDHGTATGEHGTHPADAAPETVAPAVLELTPEAEAILAQADRVDGTEDHVVAKCPGCNLAMDGTAEHAAHVGDYELHFCSEGCSRRFQEDTNASILAMKMP